MPQRDMSLPSSDNEPKYLVVVHPYPLNANLNIPADRRALALWLACCTGKRYLLAMFHKPSSPGMVIIEVDCEFKRFDDLLGKHTWSKILVNPDSDEEDKSSEVFYCNLETGRDVETKGWKRIWVEEHWFSGWRPDNTRFKYPYPQATYYDVPPEAKTGEPLCRPLTQNDVSSPMASMSDLSSEDFSETHFDSYPDADIILRSSDSHEYHVPKLFIINSSPILAKLVQTAPITSDAATSAPGEPGASLTRVQLPENHTILSCLLTFIFPVSPILPWTTGQIMELLSAAQKYEMKSALIHIRDHVARHRPWFMGPGNALYVFSLAQRYKLRDEVLQAARITLSTSMTFDDLDGHLGTISGAFLYELWKYHQRVRENLSRDLLGFRMSDPHGTLEHIHCIKLSSFGIPSWLEDYIESVRNAPSCFDLSKFHMSLTRHTSPTTTSSSTCPSCASISSETIHAFWGALTAVVHNSFRRAESELILVANETHFQNPITSGEALPTSVDLNLRETDVILQSSDFVHFHVHKLILATSSPFFSDMFSLAQPSHDEIYDGLPMVRLPEDAEVLHSLVTMLYPIPTIVPDSYEKVLDLLAASQKYDMGAVQSSIRAEVSQKTFTTLTGSGVFRAYAMASSKRLVPEMENAARLTLDYPMTFECLGDDLGLFDSWALRDLVNYRRRCRDSVVSCLESFLYRRDEASEIWDGCPQIILDETLPEFLLQGRKQAIFARWLHDFISRNVRELESSFTRPLLDQSNFRKQFMQALQNHIKDTDCSFCSRHVMEGESYLGQIQDELKSARDKVPFHEPLVRML